MITAVTISPINMDERKNLGIRAGDSVRVWQKIEEKGKTRRQAFEGLVLARKHGNEAGATFTVRRVASGVGVEKIFPLYSPQIDQIDIVRRAKVRRAKLYYIRDKAARDVRKQMRSMVMMPTAKKTVGAESVGEQAESVEMQEDTAVAEE